MRRGNFSTIVFCSAVLALSPSIALAGVQITEVMYDASGADAGHEWIEVTNTGSSAIDISGYKFFEANTNHALTLKSGTGVLQPQSSAVIADDDVKFKTDWPNFSGTLFDSSFSLSNSGESLAVKDGTLSALDSVSYDPAMGAAGDGNSLHRSDAAFIAAAPTPGAYSEGGSTAPSSDSVQSSSSAPPPQSPSPTDPGAIGGAMPPLITAHIAADVVSMVGGGSFFSGESYGTSGLPLTVARYLWNFGDGATAEGQRAFHAYSYPGKYLVMLTVASGISTASDRLAVEAVPAQVSLRGEGDGSLTVENRSSIDLDVGLWTLARGGSAFVIPEGTLIMAKGAVRFAPSILKLPDGDAQLLYPNGAVAVSESANPHAAGITYVSGADPAPERAKVPQAATAAMTVSAPLSDAPAPEALAAAAEDSGASLPLWGSLLALGALIVLGISAVLYARLPHEIGEAAISRGLPGTPALAEAAGTPAQSETAAMAEEFQIIDVTPGVEENDLSR